MSSPDEQRDFERSLLASARADRVAPDTEEAWTRFACALRAVGSSAGLDPREAAGRGPDTLGRAPDEVLAGRAASRAGWLLRVALGVASLTAAGLIVRARVGPSAPPVAPASLAGHPAAPIGAPPAFPLQPPAASGSALRAPPPSGAARRRVSAAGRQPIAQGPESGLAVEVERIETARTAAALGDHDEAIRLVERYLRDFPQSALRPDAEMVALEAAAARHDPSETARRAQLFLSLYPNDPHAARVRWLADHPDERAGDGH